MKSNGRNESDVPIDGVTALRVSPSGKALLCRISPDTEADETREVWVPLSQVSDDSEVFGVGDEGQLVVTAWFAEREGLN